MDKIDELLSRGVEKIYPSREALEKVLRSGQKIRLYQGFDPTGAQLHLGHLAGLMKLRQWQKLGHQVIFLIGDLTATIGDPSGKNTVRKPLTKEQVLANARTYQEQASRVLDFTGPNPVEIKHNSQWWAKMNVSDVMKLTSLTTHAQVIERDLFQKRVKEGKDIFLSELLYPLLQGYDSVAMDVDLEIGGTDQTFNMLMGRTLMKKIKNKEKFVMTTPLLTDAAGNKIGKTADNVIALTASPNELYGQIMSLGDDVITRSFEFLTEQPREEVKRIERTIRNGENPMECKKQLAFTLTAMLNDTAAATKAQGEFERVFQKGQLPVYDISIYHTQPGERNIISLLVETKLSSSTSEAKRLVEQGGVAIGSEQMNNVFQRVKNKNEKIKIRDGVTIKAGKRRFITLKVASVKD